MVREEQEQTVLSLVIGEYALDSVHVAFAMLDATPAIVDPLMQTALMTGI